MPTLIEQAANPVDHRANASSPAKIAMYDDPIFGSDLRYRRGYPFKQSLGVTDKTRQYAVPGAGANGRELHRHVRGAYSDRAAALAQPLLHPAGGRVVRLFFRVSYPGVTNCAGPVIDGAGEHAGLGDVEVSAFRRMVAQREIGFAACEVGGLLSFDEFEGNP